MVKPIWGELRERDALRGEVLLRDVAEGDLPLFFEHQIDPDANRMAAFTARNRDAFMAHWNKILGDETITIRPCSSTGMWPATS
jgi:hypothetical protein